MTSPSPEIPVTVAEGARAVGSCSRYTMSTFGGPPFAGIVHPYDIPSAHNQELVIAYLMGLVRALVAKGVITEAEFVDGVEEWLSGRKEWAEGLANETITAWNTENPEHEQQLVDANDLQGSQNAQTAEQFPLWPWMNDPAPESPQE